MLRNVDRDRLTIGAVAARSGVSRKALRLYETAGILPPPARTAAGYRVYTAESLALIAFVTRARRLGFRLNEIKEVVTIKRSGQTPCPHVHDLMRRKIAELDRTLAELAHVRRQLVRLLGSWRSRRPRAAAVCPHIESSKLLSGRR